VSEIVRSISIGVCNYRQQCRVKGNTITGDEEISPHSGFLNLRNDTASVRQGK